MNPNITPSSVLILRNLLVRDILLSRLGANAPSPTGVKWEVTPSRDLHGRGIVSEDLIIKEPWAIRFQVFASGNVRRFALSIFGGEGSMPDFKHHILTLYYFERDDGLRSWAAEVGGEYFYPGDANLFEQFKREVWHNLQSATGSPLESMPHDDLRKLLAPCILDKISQICGWFVQLPTI